MKTSNEFRDYVRNGNNLQLETIGASLNVLLQIEDIDTMRQYFDLKAKNVILRSYGDEYSFQLKTKNHIHLEGLLSVYDEVVLTMRTDINMNNEEILDLMMHKKSDMCRMKETFSGLIQHIDSERISFKCDQKLDIHKSYTVICRPSRLNLRYQYQSLKLLSTNMTFLRKFLFPTKLIPMPLSTVSLNLYNKNLNEEQLQAVRNIAEGPRNDATYIIFGPPGTGKTTTVVESILQVLRKPGTKILVTASSNSACDEIALKLCKFLKELDITRAMVRIYSRSSEIRTDTIDEELLENSNMYNGQFYPDVEMLHEFRVVVCTLSVVGKLTTGNFGRSKNDGTVYTHLFIDEVAASMETEAFIAITAVLTPKSCLIISGDHKQLGPVLQSKRAKELGLGASLMDRLLERECYRVDIDTGNYDRTIQTRLVKNYRSHPAIVNLYSGLYYNQSIEALANPDDISLCEVWHRSRNKQYPISFHAVYGTSKHGDQSTSLYNIKELNTVMDYVKDFMYFGINGEPVKETDIGIISPYRKQYQLIQEQLKLRKWFSIETGAVETFQGKEKQIIIVSFVRSGTEHLGFLDNPRRLNVILSRPKSLLILIGNPETLSLNSEFEYIIKQCQCHNTFIDTSGGGRGNKKSTSFNNNANGRNGLGSQIVEQNNKKNQTCITRNNDTNKTNLIPDELPQVPKTFPKTTNAYTKTVATQLPSNLSSCFKINSSAVSNNRHLTKVQDINTNILKASVQQTTSYSYKQQVPSTNSGNSSNASATNPRNDKLKANVHPAVQRNSCHTFFTDTDVNKGLHPSSSSSNVIQNNTYAVLDYASVYANMYRTSSSSYLRCPTVSTNAYNFNNALPSLNNTSTFTTTNFDSDLKFHDQKRKKGKKCVIL